MIKTERSDILKCYIYGYCIPKLKLNLTYLVLLRQTFFLFLKNKNVYCTEMNLPQLHDWQSYFITHWLGRTFGPQAKQQPYQDKYSFEYLNTPYFPCTPTSHTHIQNSTKFTSNEMELRFRLKFSPLRKDLPQTTHLTCLISLFAVNVLPSKIYLNYLTMISSLQPMYQNFSVVCVLPPLW